MLDDATPPVVQEDIRNILQIGRNNFEERYLGFPTPDGRMNKGKFQTLQEKIWKRVIQWGESLLSMGGKEVMIKAVLHAIPVYVMGIFKLSESVCEDLNKLIRNFWWGTDGGKRKRKTHWKSWSVLTKPKNCGGMGFRDVKLFNQALLARQAWRLLQFPDSLCARVLKAKYYPNGSLVDTAFGGNTSPSWKGVIYGLELLKQGIVWRIGNGRSVRMWRDPWIPREHTRRPITAKDNSRLKWVSDLIDVNGGWDADKVSRVFWGIDAEAILKISLPSREEEDFLAWNPDRYGQFSVRSAYHLAVSLAGMEESSSSSDIILKNAWNNLWKCNVPQKVKIFAWKAVTNGLVTMENKKKRNLEANDMCIICNREKEDTGHALCRCPQANLLLLSMHKAGNISFDCSSIRGGPSWLLDHLGRIPEHERAMFLMILWRNWHVRNEVIHDKPAPPIEASKRFLESYMTSRLQIKQNPSANLERGKCAKVPTNLGQRLGGKVQERWRKPSEGWMKLNVDGSFSAAEENGGTGMILRNSNGSIIFSSCKSLAKCSNALEAELITLADGLVLAIQWTFLPVMVETDSLVALQLIQAQAKDLSPLFHVVQEIKRLMVGDREVLVQKIHRSQNQASHVLANIARSTQLSQFWIGDSCNFVSQFAREGDLVE